MTRQEILSMVSINGERIISIEPDWEINSDGNWEEYFIVRTWVAEYFLSSIGECLSVERF